MCFAPLKPDGMVQLEENHSIVITTGRLFFPGMDQVVIESQFFDSFSIKANLHFDSPEDIAQKVANVTGIPTTYMSFYTRYELNIIMDSVAIQ